jgi:hypothetical protein
MKCPYCGDNTKDAWRQLIVACPPWSTLRLLSGEPSLEEMSPKQLDAPNQHTVTLDWMVCEAERCKQLVIRVHESYLPSIGNRHDPRTYIQQTDTWFARPHQPVLRRAAEGIPDDLKCDYEEAASILDLSPRMSAVLSRRILGDLLERYAGIKNRSLAKQIDTFIADTSHPRRLREGLHHFREAADFAAHTQTDEQSGEIINVGRDEAEWTLDRVDGLFEYFIIEPDQESQRLAAMDKKIADAGRKAIPPLPPDPPRGTS